MKRVLLMSLLALMPLAAKAGVEAMKNLQQPVEGKSAVLTFGGEGGREFMRKRPGNGEGGILPRRSGAAEPHRYLPGHEGLAEGLCVGEWSPAGALLERRPAGAVILPGRVSEGGLQCHRSPGSVPVY